MERVLHEQILPVARRKQFRRIVVGLAIVWSLAAVVAVAFYWGNQQGKVDPQPFLMPLGIGVLVASLLVIIANLLFRPSAIALATEIESRFPELDSKLLTAVELKRKPGQTLGFLEQDVVRSVVRHSQFHPWKAMIPMWQIVGAILFGFIGFLGFHVAMFGMLQFAKPVEVDPTIPFQAAVVDQRDYQVKVEPGDTEVERGTSLLVLARFGSALPPDASLIYLDSEGTESSLAMSKSLDDPVFGARIPSINSALQYRVEYVDQVTENFQVTVFEYPKLARADARLMYPEYTELAEKTIQDFRRINAVKGTELELFFYLNKPVTVAQLIPRDEGEIIDLVLDAEKSNLWTTRFELLESQKYELRLTDDVGRTNRVSPKFTFNAVENKLPDLKLTSPARDIQASPLEEIMLSANAWDDFGLTKFGVSYMVPGSDDLELELEQKPAGKKKKKVDYLLALEELNAQPDDLVSYFFWAEDVGPDGESRRVSSDMYFAEVRHFDTIFRQGQAPAGGQQQQQQQGGQNGQQAQQLAELQKEIINATWKLIRRERGETPSDAFETDVRTIKESQESAIEQLDALAEELEDPQSKTFVDSARGLMNEAVLHLTDAELDQKIEALKPALASEQAAYQGLLKLRAREQQVVQQQQQQMGNMGQNQGNRQQQQLDQLNLKEDENRYENERTAQEQSQQQQEQQEDRQVLSRLRELARRQNDLNERIKELQNALEEAETQEEREEIERRLKSLREQQEQMLRDTDELLERMKEDENQQRMAENAEQLEQTRENLQRASEALQNNQVSRAAAEGTRAQRDLEDLRDEFQEKTAGQFTEQMREMRNEAQDIEKEQAEIAEEIFELNSPTQQNSPPTLRDEGEAKPDLEQRLQDQQQAVEQLRQKMRETIEEAESFEPLLAEDLYDTYRDSETSRPDRALESTRRSINRGWMDDARIEEERARQGIEEIRQGIEKAAESVLGDETQALKAAQENLKKLNQQLQDEIEANRTDRDQDQESERQRDGNQGQRSGERSEQDGNERTPSDSENSDSNQRSPGKGQAQDPDERQDAENQDQSGRGQSSQPSESEERGQGGQSENQGEQGQGQQSNESRQGNGQGQRDGVGGEANEQDALEEMRRQMRQLGQPTGEANERGGRFNMSGGGNQRMMQPITGDDFRDWSDLLRDVEEMVSDPDLRSEASRIREQAREIRKDLKRHSVEPNWDLIKLKIANPLAELQDRVAEEILRRNSKNSLVPLDRDPVPAEYQDAVQKYYERLGSGQ